MGQYQLQVAAVSNYSTGDYSDEISFEIAAVECALTVNPSITSVLPTLVEPPQPTSSSISEIVAGGVTLLAVYSCSGGDAGLLLFVCHQEEVWCPATISYHLQSSRSGLGIARNPTGSGDWLEME